MKKTLVLLLPAMLMWACTNTRVPVEESPEHFSSNPMGSGPVLEIEMIRGDGHNHPLMAIWVEKSDGAFVQTLYVAESIGKGVFQHGDASRGFWIAGEIQRPAALPYWSHKRGIKNEQQQKDRHYRRDPVHHRDSFPLCRGSYLPTRFAISRLPGDGLSKQTNCHPRHTA